MKNPSDLLNLRGGRGVKIVDEDREEICLIQNGEEY